MRILFIHQNFPGQFKHLAPVLAADPRNQVVALVMRKNETETWQNVRLVSYHPGRGTAPNVHPWVSDFETKIIRAEAAFRNALALRESGFIPDIIMAHPGWGESLFLKDVWPKARLVIYCEFFYHVRGADVGFDPEYPADDPGEVCRLRLKNLNNLLHFDLADAGLSPTRWQADTFPEPFRGKIQVIHDGIDTLAVAPNPAVSLTLNHHLTLTRQDEIITFVNRSLEPYRGYHTFMRALPVILKHRPKARVIIVGDEGVSYGKALAEGQSYKKRYLEEVAGQIDLSRVHFVGKVPYHVFLAIIQLSAVHVYLTYPFVLSWSMLEAMAAGCLVVGSKTPPVEEVVIDGENGLLVDFFAPSAVAEAVNRVLDDPDRMQKLRENARRTIVEKYDLQKACLPQQVQLIQEQMGHL